MIYQIYAQRFYLQDSYEYILAAENLLERGRLYCGIWQEPLRMDFFTKRPPLYPLILACSDLLFDTYYPVIILQNLLSLFNLYITLKIVGVIIPPDCFQSTYATDRLLSLLLFLFLLVYPPQFIYANVLMTEIFFQTLLTTGTYCLLHAYRRKHLIWPLLNTLCIMLAMLIKPVMYLFAIPHMIIMGIGYYRFRRYPLLILAILPSILVWGYQEWNEQRTGYFHYSSIQNLSLFQYTTHNLLVQEMGAEEALAYTDSVLYRSLAQPTYQEEQQMIAEFCKETLLAHLPAYILMHIKGMLNFFLDPGRFDFFHFWGIADNSSGLLKAFSQNGYKGVWGYLTSQTPSIMVLLFIILVAQTLKLLGMGLFVFDKNIRLQDRLIILIMVGYIAGLTGTSGASRFAVPVNLLFLVGILSIIAVRCLRIKN